MKQLFQKHIGGKNIYDKADYAGKYAYQPNLTIGIYKKETESENGCTNTKEDIKNNICGLFLTDFFSEGHDKPIINA